MRPTIVGQVHDLDDVGVLVLQVGEAVVMLEGDGITARPPRGATVSVVMREVELYPHDRGWRGGFVNDPRVRVSEEPSSSRHEVVEVAKAALRKFFGVFQAETVIGLILPDGWYDRPWDNYYELSQVESVGRLLNASLGYGWRVSLTPNSVSTPSPYELNIGAEDIVIGDLHDSRRYDRGEVRFVVSGGSAIVERIVNDAAGELASIPTTPAEER